MKLAVQAMPELICHLDVAAPGMTRTCAPACGAKASLATKDLVRVTCEACRTAFDIMVPAGLITVPNERTGGSSLPVVSTDRAHPVVMDLWGLRQNQADAYAQTLAIRHNFIKWERRTGKTWLAMRLLERQAEATPSGRFLYVGPTASASHFALDDFIGRLRRRSWSYDRGHMVVRIEQPLRPWPSPLDESTLIYFTSLDHLRGSNINRLRGHRRLDGVVLDELDPRVHIAEPVWRLVGFDPSRRPSATSGWLLHIAGPFR